MHAEISSERKNQGVQRDASLNTLSPNIPVMSRYLNVTGTDRWTDTIIVSDTSKDYSVICIDHKLPREKLPASRQRSLSVILQS